MHTTAASHALLRWSESGAPRLSSLRITAPDLLATKPILLLGAPGSGHDWLHAVLGAHPQRPLIDHTTIRTYADIAAAHRSHPDAQLIHLIRDGRDAILDSGPDLAHPISPEAVRQRAADWARSIHAAWTARDTQHLNLLEVKLEHLRTPDAAHGDSLLNSLALDPDDHTATLLTAPSATPLPTWRTHFTNDAKHAFKATAGALLIELNYEPDMNW
jgi:hypothetical protein